MSDMDTLKEIKGLLIQQNHSPDDISLVEKAYKFAKKTHDGQFRVSGEPYIIHPCEVAKILVGLEVDTNTIIAAFLHDILEDTDTKPETIKEMFGDDVLNLVQGVTKLGKLKFKTRPYKFMRSFLMRNFVNKHIYGYFSICFCLSYKLSNFIIFFGI